MGWGSQLCSLGQPRAGEVLPPVPGSQTLAHHRQCRKNRSHLGGAEPARVMPSIRNYPGVRTPAAPSCNFAWNSNAFLGSFPEERRHGSQTLLYGDTEIITKNTEQKMSHTTGNNDNVQLFHRLTKPLTKCRKTLQFSWSPPSLYHLFQIH